MSILPTIDSPTHQTAMPSAFPEPGSFGVTQRVTLLSATPGATIHYTLDGSTPDRSSPTFDPYQLPVLEAIDDGGQRTRTTYTVKAFAVGDGLAPSDVASFSDEPFMTFMAQLCTPIAWPPARAGQLRAQSGRGNPQ